MSGLVKQRRDLVAAIGVGILSLGNMAVPKVRRWRSETRRGLEPSRSQVRPSVTFTEAGWDGGPSAIKRARPLQKRAPGFLNRSGLSINRRWPEVRRSLRDFLSPGSQASIRDDVWFLVGSNVSYPPNGGILEDYFPKKCEM